MDFFPGTTKRKRRSKSGRAFGGNRRESWGRRVRQGRQDRSAGIAHGGRRRDDIGTGLSRSGPANRLLGLSRGDSNL